MTIYLDNASTSYPKPDCIYRRMEEFLRESGANPGRAGHRMATRAEREIDIVRFKIAKLIGAQNPNNIVFTLNGTDALNIAIKGILKPGDHVITSVLEHNSVSRPLERLRTDGLITVTRVGIDSRGLIDPEDVRKELRSNTRLIVLTHASNVLGTIQPIADVGQIVRDHNLLFLVDAAQSAGGIPIDVRESNIDLLAAPGHKSLLGPPGTGFLFVGNRAESAITSVREGGTGGDSSSRLQPEEFPFRLEGGTPNTAGISALGAAIDFITARGLGNIREHESALMTELFNQLKEISGLTTYPSDPSADRVGVLSFNVEGFTAAEFGVILDQSFDIAVRPGLHCAPYTHEAIGTSAEGTIRASIGPFTTRYDIESLSGAIKEILGT